MIKGVEQLDEEQQSGIMLFMLLKKERNIMGLKVPGKWSEKSSGITKKLINKVYYFFQPKTKDLPLKIDR